MDFCVSVSDFVFSVFPYIFNMPEIVNLRRFPHTENVVPEEAVSVWFPYYRNSRPYTKHGSEDIPCSSPPAFTCLSFCFRYICGMNRNTPRLPATAPDSFPIYHIPPLPLSCFFHSELPHFHAFRTHIVTVRKYYFYALQNDVEYYFYFPHSSSEGSTAH